VRLAEAAVRHPATVKELPQNCPRTVMFASQDQRTIKQYAGAMHAMSSLDFDIDAKMIQLEMEWRQAYEASVAARAEYQALAANRKADAAMLDLAQERLDRAEATKAKIMVKIERLEDTLLGQD